MYPTIFTHAREGHLLEPGGGAIDITMSPRNKCRISPIKTELVKGTLLWGGKKPIGNDQHRR
jgi:hypothetical protein